MYIDYIYCTTFSTTLQVSTKKEAEYFPAPFTSLYHLTKLKSYIPVSLSSPSVSLLLCI